MKKTKIILIFILFLALSFSVFYFFFFKNENIKENNLNPKVENTLNNEYAIIAFGDSLTAGYGLILNESYPAQLERILNKKGKNVKVINAGISGETSKGSLERAEFIRGQNPDMVIFGIGGNDALRALSVSEMKKNIDQTLQILLSQENPPKVLLLEMQSPLNAGFQYKKEFDAVYKDLAQKYKIPLVPFLVSSVFLKSEYMLEDRIHPNEKGYEKIINDYVLDFVLKEI
jgi:acyl-CoA thioesterase-1